MEEKHLVAFCGEVLEFSIGPTSDPEETNILQCTHYQFNKTSSSLQKKTALGNHYIRTRGCFSIVTVSCVLDSQRSLYKPTVAVHSFHNQNSESEFSFFLYNHRDRQFVPLGGVEGIRDQSYMTSSCKVQLLDGPILFWHHGNKFNVVQRRPSSNEFFWKVFPKPDSLVSLYKWVGVSMTGIKLLATQSSPAKTGLAEDDIFGERSKWVFVDLNPIDSSLSSAECSYLPNEYSDITEIVYISHKQRTSTVQSTILGFNQKADEILIFVVTSFGQLLEFDSHKLKRVCQLSFKDASKMVLAVASGGEEFLLVQSHDHGVCVISLHNFKVSNSWPQCDTVLVDDFLLCGSDQLLLLLKSPLGSTSDSLFNFVLTDLKTVWSQRETSCSSEVCDVTVPCPPNLSSAVHALEKRLQKSIASLGSVRLLCEQKDAVITQSREALLKISTVENTSSVRDPSLLCLVEGNPATVNIEVQDSSDLRAEVQDCRDPHQDFKPVDIWQRLVGQTLVVGVHCVSVVHRPICDVHLSLVKPFWDAHCTFHVNESEMTCCKVRSPEIPENCIEEEYEACHKSEILSGPEIKRRKTSKSGEGDIQYSSASSGSVFDLLSRTTLPKFTSSEVVKFHLVVCWKECQKKVEAVDPFSNHDHHSNSNVVLVERCKFVGVCSISVQDVLDKTFNVRMKNIQSGALSREDLLALNFAQLESWLTIISSNTYLTNIPSRVCCKLGFSAIEDTGQNKGFFCRTGILREVRLYVLQHKDGPTVIKLKVFTSDKGQLVLLCRGLYSILPDDAVIQPTFCQSHNATTLRALSRELEDMNQCIGTVTNDCITTSSLLQTRLKTDISMQTLIR